MPKSKISSTSYDAWPLVHRRADLKTLPGCIICICAFLPLAPPNARNTAIVMHMPASFLFTPSRKREAFRQWSACLWPTLIISSVSWPWPISPYCHPDDKRACFFSTVWAWPAGTGRRAPPTISAAEILVFGTTPIIAAPSNGHADLPCK